MRRCCHHFLIRPTRSGFWRIASVDSCHLSRSLELTSRHAKENTHGGVTRYLCDSPRSGVGGPSSLYAPAPRRRLTIAPIPSNWRDAGEPRGRQLLSYRRLEIGRAHV